MNNLFTINWVNVKSALVSVVLAVILATAGYVIGLGDVFKIETHALVNVAVMAGLVGIVSLIKSYLTDSNGKFVGTTQIK